MIFESEKTEKGNIGVSFESQEKANEQAKKMDSGGNVNCNDCSDCNDCRSCSGCSGFRDKKETAPAIPKIVDIDKVVYAAVTASPESLNMDEWHVCETTHCRAGWVVHLAGAEGYALEKFFNSTAKAARLIYRESGSPINPCRFFESNNDALTDMKLRAEINSGESNG